MKIYNYNKDTKEYLSTTQASENPLEKGKYLIPANATSIAIGVDKVGFVQVFNEANKKWGYVEDNRSKIVYDTTTKQESKVDYLGVIKSGFTELIPNASDKWNGSKWLLDITISLATKLSELETAYNNANELDIAYLGTTFQADTKSQDLIVKVLSAGSVPTGFFWIDKANNQVAMTYTQVQGLSGAILTRNQVNFIKFQGLKARVKLATTQAELDAIVW